jgi:hypothetical protein
MGLPSASQAGSGAVDTGQDGGKRAFLEIYKPQANPPKRIPLCFNPTEYQVSKQNTFQEVPIPGLGAPPIQFIRGTSEKLTFEAIVDTSDEMTDVRKKYVNDIRNLLAIDGDIHAPPVVKFVWETFEFIGVIESLNISYTLFAEAGFPVRAKLGFALKEYTTVDQQRAIAKLKSPDVEKTYVVKRGDTLSGIAEQAYGDPRPWRTIALANGITDPRTLAPGRVLTIPRLEVTA